MALKSACDVKAICSNLDCTEFGYAVECSDAGAIKAIYSGIDFTKDGINEVAVGRDTGSLEVYGFDQQQQPVLVFQASLEESISTIDGGFFTSPNVQVGICSGCTVLLWLNVFVHVGAQIIWRNWSRTQQMQSERADTGVC